jgi:hypothetical protein
MAAPTSDDEYADIEYRQSQRLEVRLLARLPASPIQWFAKCNVARNRLATLVSLGKLAECARFG